MSKCFAYVSLFSRFTTRLYNPFVTADRVAMIGMSNDGSSEILIKF